MGDFAKSGPTPAAGIACMPSLPRRRSRKSMSSGLPNATSSGPRRSLHIDDQPFKVSGATRCAASPAEPATTLPPRGLTDKCARRRARLATIWLSQRWIP